MYKSLIGKDEIIGKYNAIYHNKLETSLNSEDK